jgi:hypothetical protein
MRSGLFIAGLHNCGDGGEEICVSDLDGLGLDFESVTGLKDTDPKLPMGPTLELDRCVRGGEA